MSGEPTQIPSLDDVATAGSRVKEAERHAAEKHEEARTADREVEDARRELETLLQGLRSSQQSSAPQTPVATPKSEPPVSLDGGPYPQLTDSTVAMVWRIAFHVLRTPRLDYVYVGRQIWGADADAKEVKNRVNSHMATLRKLGISRSLGNNRFEINAELLAEKSGIPVR